LIWNEEEKNEFEISEDISYKIFENFEFFCEILRRVR